MVETGQQQKYDKNSDKINNAAAFAGSTCLLWMETLRTPVTPGKTVGDGGDIGIRRAGMHR
jgi:hypothetical protein